MVTGGYKQKIDEIWNHFWTGGITNTITIVEQMTFLMFIKGLDDLQKNRERMRKLGVDLGPDLFKPEQKGLRWSFFIDKQPEEMFEVVSKEVFPYLQELGKQADQDNLVHSIYKVFSTASLEITSAVLLQRVVDGLQELFQIHDRGDHLGNIYEYMLGKLSSSGTNGQFRTPAHIRRMMVELMQPSPKDIICDPAVGTAGFLEVASQYIKDHHSDIFTDGKLKDERDNYHNMFHGFDTDKTMVRLASINLYVHGIENPNIVQKDALSTDNEEEEKYSLVLANPPFKGTLDFNRIHPVIRSIMGMKESKSTSKSPSGKTELLFLALMLRMLHIGGRAAVIVPDGVLFGTSKAHVNIRKEIIENNKLEAVISMPSGVFKPYAGVSTAVLIFTKTGKGGTDQVWFYDMLADGFTLDDKRNQLDINKHEENNIPDIIARFHNPGNEKGRARTDQSFFVPVQEIIDHSYDLSINRYKEVVYEQVQYESPQAILDSLKQLEKEIQEGLQRIEGMIK